MRKDTEMQRYVVKIKRYNAFCDLCNEHHSYFDCPACTEDFYGLVLEGREITCPHCNTSYIYWGKNKKGSHLVLAKCSETLSTRVYCIWCSYNDSDYSSLCRHECAEYICPLFKRQQERLRILQFGMKRE